MSLLCQFFDKEVLNSQVHGINGIYKPVLSYDYEKDWQSVELFSLTNWNIATWLQG